MKHNGVNRVHKHFKVKMTVFIWGKFSTSGKKVIVSKTDIG